MDSGAFAALCGAILGGGAVLTGLFRVVLKISRAADMWSDIVDQFTPNREGTSIVQRLNRVEDSVADIVKQGRGK